MANFEQCIKYVLQNEGGYSDHAADRGGRTRYGITERLARKYGKDIAGLTELDALWIYREEFWQLTNLAQIASTRIAAKVLDICVNCGPRRGIEMLQGALNRCGAGLNIDGVLGDKTLDAVNRMQDEDKVLSMLSSICTRHYCGIVQADKSQGVFLLGWILRALRQPT